MMRDWEATSGFVEVRSKNMVTWSLMFARMDHNTLYFYEDESEQKALFAVQFTQGFSVEALKTGFQFEIRNNNLEDIRTPLDVEEGDTEGGDTEEAGGASIMSTSKDFLKKFGRQIFASGSAFVRDAPGEGLLQADHCLGQRVLRSANAVDYARQRA